MSTMRVYDGEEVDRYIADLHNHIEALDAQIEELRRQVVTSSQAAHDDAAQRVLGRALLQAQAVAEQAADDAQRDRRQILDEAKRQASEILAVAEQQRVEHLEQARRRASDIIAEAQRQQARVTTVDRDPVAARPATDPDLRWRAREAQAPPLRPDDTATDADRAFAGPQSSPPRWPQPAAVQTIAAPAWPRPAVPSEGTDDAPGTGGPDDSYASPRYESPGPMPGFEPPPSTAPTPPPPTATTPIMAPPPLGAPLIPLSAGDLPGHPSEPGSRSPWRRLRR